MAITTVDDIATALTSKQRSPFTKVLTAPKAIGAYQSGWMGTGYPAAGVAPPAYTAGSGYTCDRTTVGSLLYTNGAVQNWLARVAAIATQPGSVIFADRLWACGGMGFTNATYTVTTPGALPARITDSGLGCELWVEQYVAAGAATGTLTATYVNTVPTAGKTGVISTVVSAPVAGQMQPFPLASGDLGISQLTSIANSATWTSGSWGAVILKRIVEVPIMSISVATNYDWAACALAKLPANACPMVFWLAQNTTAPTLIGTLDIIDK